MLLVLAGGSRKGHFIRLNSSTHYCWFLSKVIEQGFQNCLKNLSFHKKSRQTNHGTPYAVSAVLFYTCNTQKRIRKGYKALELMRDVWVSQWELTSTWLEYAKEHHMKYPVNGVDNKKLLCRQYYEHFKCLIWNSRDGVVFWSAFIIFLWSIRICGGTDNRYLISLQLCQLLTMQCSFFYFLLLYYGFLSIVMVIVHVCFGSSWSL